MAHSKIEKVVFKHSTIISYELKYPIKKLTKISAAVEDKERVRRRATKGSSSWNRSRLALEGLLFESTKWQIAAAAAA